MIQIKSPMIAFDCFAANVGYQTAKAAHIHAMHEFFVCTDAHGSQFPAGMEIRQRRGDVFCFPPGMPHYASGSPKAGGHVVMVSSSMFTPETYGDRDTHQTLQRITRLALSGRNPLPVARATSAQVLRIAAEMTQEIKGKKAGYEAAVRCLLQKMLLHLRRDPGVGAETTPRGGVTRHEEQIARVLRFIESHFMEEIRVEHVAAMAAMSRSSMHAAFRQVAGCTLVDYVTQVRVRAALRLLRASDATVIQIALDCGFNTTSRFYDAFRKITGKTPREIRAEG